MIRITESEEKNEMCQCCRGRGKASMITFECRYGQNVQGVSIILCDKCREELVRKLKGDATE